MQDDDALLRRLRVVAITTRVAARSLGTDTAQADQAVRRGLVLLDGIEADVPPDSADVRSKLEQTREELQALMDGRG
jgi:hypothetical protein